MKDLLASYRFNRMEFAGSLGDLGTLLPLVIGMVAVNQVSSTAVFYTVGIFYIVSGCYFRVPIAIQPMKVVAAYAIAANVSYSQINAATGLICLFLLFIGLTNTITAVSKWIPKPVIRGIQLSTGMLLMEKGISFIAKGGPGSELGEPYLKLQSLGPIPITVLLGTVATCLLLFFHNNKKYPAAIVVVLFGIIIGLVLGSHEGLSSFKLGLYPPPFLPAGLPSTVDLSVALFTLVIPQIPMTIGNAIIANTELSREYFKRDGQRVTYRATTISMGLANGLSFILGGIPLCHGAGGLAAHYRFGARTGGSNLIIGLIFLALAIFAGPHVIALIQLIPFSVLGVLLTFAGMQLSLTIMDMFARKDMFVVLIILAITLATSLSWGFICGAVIAHLLQTGKIEV